MDLTTCPIFLPANSKKSLLSRLALAEDQRCGRKSSADSSKLYIQTLLWNWDKLIYLICISVDYMDTKLKMSISHIHTRPVLLDGCIHTYGSNSWSADHQARTKFPINWLWILGPLQNQPKTCTEELNSQVPFTNVKMNLHMSSNSPYCSDNKSFSQMESYRNLVFYYCCV